MGAEQRRHDRVKVTVPVRLRVHQEPLEASTINVSYGGLLVDCSGAVTLRELLKLEIELIRGSEPLQVVAMPVFSKPSSSTRGYTVGLQLFGVGADNKAQWEAFVRHARAHEEVEPEPEIEDVDVWIEMTDDFDPQIDVRPKDLAQLYKLIHHELEKGSMYISDVLGLPKNTVVRLYVYHPVLGNTFDLESIVDEPRVTKQGRTVYRVLLPLLSPTLRADLERFAEGQQPIQQKAS